LGSWFGRPLPRPAEDPEDQGLGFDVETLLNRRAVLRGVGLGAVGAGLAACSSDSGGESTSGSTAGTAGEIPDETAGPYPGDGSNGPDVLEQSGIVRSDIRSSIGDASGTAEGVPMTLELTVSDLAEGGSAFAGVAVYVWHCDRQGRYSMYSEGAQDQNYLRGVQVADEDGVVRFTSIFPACYAGRWPHIHFEVYPDGDSITDSTNAIATSQVALPKATCDRVYATTGYEQSVSNLSSLSLTTDGVFGDDGGASQLGTVTGSVDDGYVVNLAVRVDTSTEPGAGGFAQGGNGVPPGPPPDGGTGSRGT
jgi:protocatechuate 3,4-dioxygenase beta subunit